MGHGTRLSDTSTDLCIGLWAQDARWPDLAAAPGLRPGSLGIRASAGDQGDEPSPLSCMSDRYKPGFTGLTGAPERSGGFVQLSSPVTPLLAGRRRYRSGSHGQNAAPDPAHARSENSRDCERPGGGDFGIVVHPARASGSIYSTSDQSRGMIKTC
jgi:hypothetical protein